MKVVIRLEVDRSDGEPMTPKQSQKALEAIEACLNDNGICIEVKDADGNMVEDVLNVTDVEVYRY